MTGNFHQSTHPLIKHKLNYLRLPQEDVHHRDYADLLREMGMLLAFEATASPERFAFPSPGTSGGKNAKWPVIVVLVRSGLIMSEGVRQVIPTRHMSHIGVFYDAEDNAMVEFMVTKPDDLADREVLIVDPFIASGRTAIAAIHIVHEYGVSLDRMSFLSCCMSHHGKMTLQEDEWAKHVRFVCGHIDDEEGKNIWIDDFNRIALNQRLYGTANKVIHIE